MAMASSRYALGQSLIQQCVLVKGLRFRSRFWALLLTIRFRVQGMEFRVYLARSHPCEVASTGLEAVDVKHTLFCIPIP